MWTAYGYTSQRRRIPIHVGLLDGDDSDGPPELVLRINRHGETVHLDLAGVAQLITNLRNAAHRYEELEREARERGQQR